MAKSTRQSPAEGAQTEPTLKVSAYEPDVKVLRTFLEQKIGELHFVELILAVIQLFIRMRDINVELMKRLANLTRPRPKSETLRRLEQQLSFGFQLAPAVKKPAPKPNDLPGGRRGWRGTGRPKLDPMLERRDESNLVPPEQRACPECGSEMLRMALEPTEILEIQPAKLYVIRRLTEVCACPHDDCIVRASPPNEIVPRGVLGPTLIVEAMANKYIDHLPIERQTSALNLAGARVTAKTLGHSVAAAIDSLDPISKLIKERTRIQPLLGADASSLPVLDRDVQSGIRTGTMWCWIGNARWVSFFYCAKGDGESAKGFLGDLTPPTIQCDGTSVLNFLERAGSKRPGCWAHARRGLIFAARSGSTDALPGVRIIRRLFAIERLSRMAKDTPDQRKARRMEHSAAVLDELDNWRREMLRSIPPKSQFGKALGYLKRQWSRLVLFMTDGNIELTNNQVERELRRLVLGRRNWLFVWQDIGGERTANILSIIGTCVAQHVNPRAYLHLVTKRILENWPHSRLDELLPDALARLHPELRIQPKPLRSQQTTLPSARAG